MTDAPSYLGLDVGTSVVKAVVFDADGHDVAVAGRPLDLTYSEANKVEQDIDAIVGGADEVITELLDKTGASPSLLAITAQGDGCWVTDSDFGALLGVSWLDGRASDIVDGWNEDGVTDQVYAVNGNLIFPGAPAAIFAWLDQHQPDLLDRATSVGSCKDILFGRLTGERATDASDSSLPFGDGLGTGYSDEVLRLTGLAGRADLLPPVVAPLPHAPVLGDQKAVAGLPAELPIFSGPFDFPASAIGAGVREVGQGLLIVGTTLGCLVLTDRVDTEGEPAGMHLATGREGRWMRAMAPMVGTASMDWLLKMLGADVSTIGAALQGSTPGAAGVQVLPYFATSGERAPFVDSRARARLDGLQLTTTRDDLLRALCESLAYAARHCFETAGLDGDLMVCGGGSRSQDWLQVFADVLGRPLLQSKSPEVGAKGAVLRALELSGDSREDPVSDAVDLDAWVEPDAVIEPDTSRKELYDEGFGRYLREVDNARAMWGS